MAEDFSNASAALRAADGVARGSSASRPLPPVIGAGSSGLDVSAVKAGAPASGAKAWDEGFIKEIVNRTVDDIIQGASYSHEATSLWVNQVVENVVRGLVKVDRDNKYIVTCMIVQNLRQGMRSATSCYWSSRTDSGYSLTYVQTAFLNS